MRPLIIFLALYRIANADWLCTEEASQRRDNSILACGVAVASNEDQARHQAFNNSQAEFNRVCNASDDCKGHQVKAIPQRTSCTETDEGYRCYRLVEFTIEEQLSDTQLQASSATDDFWERWRAKYLSR